MGRTDEARRLCEQGIAFGKARVGPNTPRRRDAAVPGLLELPAPDRREDQRPPARGPGDHPQRGRHASVPWPARTPLLIRAAFRLGQLLIDLSQLQTDLGRIAAAEQSARAAIELFEALVREVPSSSLIRIRPGCGLRVPRQGCAQGRGRRGEALAMLRKAVAILETSDRR